jgi:hypothetical protein
MKLHIGTPYGDWYEVNENGEITTKNAPTPSGQWKLRGIRHVLTGEFISSKNLTPEKLKTLKLTYRSGHPQYTGCDIDHNTMREWGNTDYHGISSMYFIEDKEV